MAPPSIPCTATAKLLLYSESNTVVCCRRDTLSLERYFTRHSDVITLLEAHSSGHLVVSYDNATAIVWDPDNGTVKSMYQMPERMTAVAWMRENSVVFGSASGKIFVFDPETTTCVCTPTLDQEITAVAPGYVYNAWVVAVGYKNGSLLVLKSRPMIDVLFNLTSTEQPSAVAGLMWHSNYPILAMSSVCGGLYTWKTEKGQQPRLRCIVKDQLHQLTPSWMGWSKFGTIVHHANYATTCWDVRQPAPTKLPVSLPTEGTIGMALYGPSASLCILTEDKTICQYNLSGGHLVASNKLCQSLALLPIPVEDIMTGTNQLQITGDDNDTSSRASTEITIMKGWDDDGETESVTDIQSTCSDTYSRASSDSPFQRYEYREESAPINPSIELFPRTRKLLYSTRCLDAPADSAEIDPRAIILSIVFGWEKSVSDLVQFELAASAAHEPHGVMLMGWLSAQRKHSIMLLDFAQKQRLIKAHGEPHTIALGMFSAGLYAEGVAFYETAGKYMEAALASILYRPTVTPVYLLRKWADSDLALRPRLLCCLDFICRLQNKPVVLATPGSTAPVGASGFGTKTEEMRNLSHIKSLRVTTDFVVQKADTSRLTRSAHPASNGHDLPPPSTFTPVTAVNLRSIDHLGDSGPFQLPQTAYQDNTKQSARRDQMLPKRVAEWTKKRIWASQGTSDLNMI